MEKENYKEIILKSAIIGSLSRAQYALDNGVNINIRNPKGKTPLILAVQFGKNEMVKFLLEKGANKNLTDKDGHTAETWSRLGNVKIQEILRRSA